MKTMSYWRILIPTLGLLLLTACSSNGIAPKLTAQHPPSITQWAQYDATDYLAQAKAVQGPLIFDWQLLAAKAYIQNGQMGQGQQLLETLHLKAHSARQKAAWRLVSAYAAQLNHHPLQAIKWLQFPSDEQSLPKDYYKSAYQQLAQLYESQHQPINAANALIKLEPYLPQQQVNNNRHHIWQLLKPLSSFKLRSYEQPGQDMLNGYLELIAISNEPVKSPQQLLDRLNQWKQTYPNNPAANFIQGSLSKALQRSLYQPKKIAVLLPLSGHFAQSGQWVRDGLLAAYSDLDRGNVQLDFIDTNSQSMATIGHKITALNSDFIIGPLLKSNVREYAKLDLNKPWLALNNLDDVNADNNDRAKRYSLSLDPETEAVQAAIQMSNLGAIHPLLLVPDNDIGKRMADSFSLTWQKNHKDMPDITFYHGRNDLQNAVKRMLLTTQSAQRINRIKALLGQDLKTEVRSRRDSNSVYIVANNIDTKLIVPFISVTISPFAKPLQLFGSSRSHQEGVNNNELNGMSVTEMPWLLDKVSDNAQRFAKLWPHATDTDKSLYAIGYDAYKILPHLAQMRGFKDYHLQGLTGILSVTENGTIHRQLVWSSYQDGHLESVYEQ
ncbi:penicillin-binding protein activator [Celerinatantimonas diazotrophica]|uniref:Penicillin-binding protein activator LpoA n=1 Tax=Celerinatantimonas diazotrophica TaxID=412034 RepID=A0A4R1KGD3_9GAMM|nr:penicillin-binding protein activator [Celerinatantimonas diazotrophica]TCK63247.1 hypothetical protein EV690_0344 [Celerinatantimonas diazotrophica]CAG9295616.1 Penicillin-binding protein activator LpoA [Celerinatantimonas diazotrophica]